MASYAIIGFGCAGYYALTAIRDADSTGNVDIYSDHPDAPYNPMLTTYYASNRLRYEGMFPFGELEDIALAYKADIYSNTAVTALNAELKEVVLADGTVRQYDKILIATGARSLVPPLPNDCSERTIYMRTLDDSRNLKKLLDTENLSSAVVAGASMAGIKVLEVLYNNGLDTTLVDMAPHIFPLAAYPETAGRIEKRLMEKGIKLKFSSGLSAIRKGSETALSVECSDQSRIPADVAALCIGTRANTSLASSPAILVNRGIVVDQDMQTSCAGIYAAGDCCEGNNLQSQTTQIIGLWANAAYQGYTAGANMAGSQKEFKGNILHNITHFFDMDFIGFGDNRIQGTRITFENKEKDLWIEAVKKDGVLAGINILGGSRISGILKNHLLSILQNHHPVISDMQKGVLLREGLSEELIHQLEGGSHDKN